MSNDGRTGAATGGGNGDDEAGAPAPSVPASGAPGGVRGTDAPDAGTEGPEGTYPAEKLDLSGGTSDGDTPVGHTGD